MNRLQAIAVKPGQRVSWRCGRLRRFGRVLDQALHPEAAAANCMAVSHNNHDVSWVESRRLKLEDEPPSPRATNVTLHAVKCGDEPISRDAEND